MTDFSSQQSRLTDGLGLIELSGEVDLYTAPRFKDDLVALIESGVEQVLVDLSRVTFIDSTALGVIISGVKRLAERDGGLAIVAGSRPVVRILDVTGLDKVLTVFDTREAALATLAAL
jgi:anti-sigma B factor antagonist